MIKRNMKGLQTKFYTDFTDNFNLLLSNWTWNAHNKWADSFNTFLESVLDNKIVDSEVAFETFS